MRNGFRLFIPLLMLLAGAAGAQALELKPYKDRLFAYPKLLESRDGGHYRIVDYSEARDIDRRDETPERRVRSNYVTPSVVKSQAELTLQTDSGPVAHVAVGRRQDASVIVAYLHGQGGDRRQGANDWTFGGNFNRIKVLMAQNGGLYLSPDVPEFGDNGVRAIAGLLEAYMAASPGAPLIVACGSAGGAICHGLARHPSIGSRLAGILLLGSFPDNGFIGSAAHKARTPLFIGHGSRDKVFGVGTLEAFHAAVRASAPDYPAMMVRFETGTHGTPIRMTDWRETINWMLNR